MTPDLTDFERHLWDENRWLRDVVRDITVRPLPEDCEGPGYATWRALMEDARERGEVRLGIRTETFVTVEWEPVDGA